MPPRYVLDACVLYPPVVRDLLLTAAVFDLFEPRWSLEILDEMRRNVLADHPDIAREALDERLIGAMTDAFPDACVDGHEAMVQHMDNHEKDRHVAAVAVHVGAAAIVTYNVRDFGGASIERAGIEVLTPPVLLDRWMADEPTVVRNVIVAIATRKRRPPMTALDVITALVRQQGFRSTAAQLTDLL